MSHMAVEATLQVAAESPTELLLAARAQTAAEAIAAEAERKEAKFQRLADEVDERADQVAQLKAGRADVGTKAIIEDREPDYSEFDQRLAEIEAQPVSPEAIAAKNALPALRAATERARQAVAAANDRLKRAEQRWLVSKQRTAIYDLHDQLEALGVALARLGALDELIPSTGPFHVYVGQTYVERLSLAFAGQPVFKPRWVHRLSSDLPAYGNAIRDLRDELAAAKAG